MNEATSKKIIVFIEFVEHKRLINQDVAFVLLSSLTTMVL